MIDLSALSPKAISNVLPIHLLTPLAQFFFKFFLSLFRILFVSQERNGVR